LNCEPREHHGNEGNQNQEKDSCSDVLNIPVSNNHDKVDLANVNRYKHVKMSLMPASCMQYIPYLGLHNAHPLLALKISRKN
jgi:hypothetical protein